MGSRAGAAVELLRTRLWRYRFSSGELDSKTAAAREQLRDKHCPEWVVQRFWDSQSDKRSGRNSINECYGGAIECRFACLYSDVRQRNSPARSGLVWQPHGAELHDKPMCRGIPLE